MRGFSQMNLVEMEFMLFLLMSSGAKFHEPRSQLFFILMTIEFFHYSFYADIDDDNGQIDSAVHGSLVSLKLTVCNILDDLHITLTECFQFKTGSGLIHHLIFMTHAHHGFFFSLLDQILDQVSNWDNKWS